MVLPMQPQLGTNSYPSRIRIPLNRFIFFILTLLKILNSRLFEIFEGQEISEANVLVQISLKI